MIKRNLLLKVITLRFSACTEPVSETDKPNIIFILADDLSYRESPDHPIRLYLVEEDTYGEHDLSSFHPEVVKSMETIMDTSYTPHEWYWIPDETREEYQKKIDKARETGNILPRLQPKSVDKLPWE